MSDKYQHAPGLWAFFGVILGLWVPPAAAQQPENPDLPDRVHLEDGSTIRGTIDRLHDDELVIETVFADALTLPGPTVIGVTSEREFAVLLDTGDQLVGRPVYTEEDGQVILDTALGDVALDEERIVGLWLPDEPTPAMLEAEREHERRVAELRERQAELEEPWSARFELGVDGSTGNAERIGVRARAEALRETEFDRLILFAEGIFAQQEGERSAGEVRGGARVEMDITDRMFVFGRLELEHDRIEEVDLRATVTGGLGYFFIDEPDHELKGRAGVGYQHETFRDGTTTDEPILELGYDYRLDFDEWLRFTHSLTYLPTLTDFLGDYRLVAETAGEIPVGGADSDWRLRAGVRNDYNSTPRPGIRRLDTAYFLNLVYHWN